MMRSSQTVHSFLLVFLGMLLSGVIYLGYTSTWERNGEQRMCIKTEGYVGVTDLITAVSEKRRTSPICANMQKDLNLQLPQGVFYEQPSVVRPEGIVTLTPWLAPIVWEGTFDPKLIDPIYKQQNITIATTVFALGKYTQFLRTFLESAEKHYFVGFRVLYYVFTDNPEEVPLVTLGAEHYLTVFKVPSLNRWQDITLGRMGKLEMLIEKRLAYEADYVFSLDVDTKFRGHWGVESLGRLVGVIHPGYYETPRDKFPYERRAKSQAYIPSAEGDYYYGGAVIGGLVKDVYMLAKTCREQLEIDAAKSIEAVWQEESHLNKYFLYNKPTKLLSPEYLWQDFKSKTKDVKIIRFSQVNKNYAAVRSNR
ncbi:globoside alpha-1,3-N-acetylgalactosaminyltransferase 1 isoform X2 [Misgurnus anguillicaudatus]|uniref:globoside alpha-1,3-N-acetylgalactosaminyltransferase 1 isoform X2 n=2 Tax=Misgurnus anguillicaudatus TaxID=75329 RepID=UPI0024356952|nr:globoside alpha-1,3-N-acetylgalactosaminyltransferase 1-like isoform X2 [Misgurnus anguillicaudatus]